MSDELPPDVDPGTDPEELERVMLLAMKEVALPGPVFRLLMGARVTPPPYEVSTGAADEADKKGMAFLLGCRPVWPVIATE